MWNLAKILIPILLTYSCYKELLDEATYEDEFQIDTTLTFHDENLSNDVFFQSFWWDIIDDQRIGTNFYSFLEDKIEDLKSSHIDLIWLPPPSDGDGMGYHPRKLFDFNSNFGSKNQLQTLLETMKRQKIHPMADIVINHRVGTFNWTDFTEPSWSCESICSDDESVFDPAAFGTIPCGSADEGEKWGGARDLNHKSLEVQEGIKNYFHRLESLGFDSWRYDFVKGYPAKYVALYNQTLPHYFSVGEYWDSDTEKLKNWIQSTHTSIAGKKINPSAAFDFPLKYNLKEAFVKFNYELLNPQNNIGLSGDENFKHLAVTFLDNHDTGCINRDDCNSLFSKNTAAIKKGYAYLLTHPGLPMIWGYHYFFQDSSGSLQSDLKNLIFIRKKYGINAKSNVDVLSTSNGLSGHYVANIDQKLIIKIGASEYSPSSEWKKILNTEDYSIWTKD